MGLRLPAVGVIMRPASWEPSMRDSLAEKIEPRAELEIPEPPEFDEILRDAQQDPRRYVESWTVPEGGE